MFDLTITHEVNELLKQVRKELRNKVIRKARAVPIDILAQCTGII